MRSEACFVMMVGVPALAACSAPANGAPASAATTDRPPEAAPAPMALNAPLDAAFARWAEAGPSGDEAHRERLERLAGTVRQRLAATGRVDLVFVCTHNSRRSHMAQLLGLAAARRKGFAGVRTFSGGTEATAFNPRAIAALQRVGFEIAATGDGGSNPRYAVRLAGALGPVESFSKRIADPPNPTSDFVAVMTCSQADAACPNVQGAVARIAVPYDDPKAADGTPEEATRYDERVGQIGRDLAWVFERVATR